MAGYEPRVHQEASEERATKQERPFRPSSWPSFSSLARQHRRDGIALKCKKVYSAGHLNAGGETSGRFLENCLRAVPLSFSTRRRPMVLAPCPRLVAHLSAGSDTTEKRREGGH